MIDLNSGSGVTLRPPDFADHINAAIDAGILARRAREPKRNYLGASLLGEPCTRKLVYIASGKPPDAEFTPRTLRIFDIGHDMEDFLAGEGSEQNEVYSKAAARWFHDAGFDLRVKGRDGKQFGWEALGGWMQGHIDGVFCGGPDIPGLAYPALWENKAVNKKSWSGFKKHGVKIKSPTYHGQTQLNMGYLDVWQTVFTTVNKDTEELNHELVSFDQSVAQRLSDRALEIKRMVEVGVVPERISQHADFYLCKMCGYARGCWI